MLFILTGCSDQNAVPKINTAISSEAEVVCSDCTYNCSISYVNSKTASVTINSPDSLKGLKFTRADNGITLSLGSLQCKSGLELTSDRSFIPTLLDMLDSAGSAEFSRKTDSLYEFTGHSKNGDYKISADSEGNIIKAESELFSLTASQPEK